MRYIIAALLRWFEFLIPKALRRRIAKELVADGELIYHLPLFAPPGVDAESLAEYIRWLVSTGRTHPKYAKRLKDRLIKKARRKCEL